MFEHFVIDTIIITIIIIITVIIFVIVGFSANVERDHSFLFLAQTSGDPQLLAEYNECVEKLKDFRSSHLQIVARLALLIN